MGSRVSPNGTWRAVQAACSARCAYRCLRQTDTCDGLSPVNGDRCQSAHRSASSRPASLAIRSSSEGQTYRKGVRTSQAPVAICDEVMGDGVLGNEIVVAVVSDVAPRVSEDDGVVARDEAAQVRYTDLDHEASTRLQVGGSVGEARDLPVLAFEVPDRVVEEVDELEGTLHSRRCHISHRDGDGVSARLGPELRHHVGGELDAADRHASGGEWHGDSPGADGHLEGGTGAGKSGQEIDGWSENLGRAHGPERVVVALRDLAGEVVVRHARSFACNKQRSERVMREIPASRNAGWAA